MGCEWLYGVIKALAREKGDTHLHAADTGGGDIDVLGINWLKKTPPEIMQKSA